MKKPNKQINKPTRQTSTVSQCGSLGEDNRKSGTIGYFPVESIKNHANFKNNYKAILIMVGLGIIISVGYLFVLNNSSKEGQLVPRPYDNINNSFALENSSSTSSHNTLNPQVSEVASYFNCSCGDCLDPELSSCQCPTAKTQRNFIQQKLDEGKSIEDVRMLVYQQYGHAKPEYSSRFNKNLSTKDMIQDFIQVQ